MNGSSLISLRQQINLVRRIVNIYFFNALKTLPDLKNNGSCFDIGGTQEFSCTCVGIECQNNLCNGLDCQNGGNCVIKVINGIRTPTCDCPDNTGGETCQISTCGTDESQRFCYYGACGGPDNEICICDQENGKAKYHGESCDMPAACDGNPCHNGGICTGKTQPDYTQACFVINYQI